MSILGDARILYHLAFTPLRGATQAERMERFYAPQAEDYDSFRSHSLPGRSELYGTIPLPPQGVLIDMGSGTGSCLDFLGSRAGTLRRIYLIDVAPSLLAIARRRISIKACSNVRVVETDAARFQPQENEGADAVCFSYSLAMIPNWREALDHALTLLRPGGHIGVVEFYVSEERPSPKRLRHPWIVRRMSPSLYKMGGLHLDPRLVAHLHDRFTPVSFQERRFSFRYLPGLPAYYFLFIGKKMEHPVAERAEPQGYGRSE